MSCIYFPFNSLSDHELRSLFIENFCVGDLNSSIYHFDPTNLSDSYNRNVDPDIASITNFLYENFCSNYYDYEELSRVLQCSYSSGIQLKIISQNIRSINKNFEEFHHDVSDQNFDIIALNETWLSTDILQLYASFGNYNGTFKCRNRLGGGVGLYVSKTISFDVVDEFSFIEDGLGCIFISFKFLGEHFLIGNLYRPPRGNLNIFIERLSGILENCLRNFAGYKLYILGDFNINILRYIDCTTVQSFLNMMFSYGLCPMIRRPTRVFGISATILDHIWTTDLNVKCSGIIRSCITDHYSVFVSTNILSNNHPNDNNLVTYRNFSQRNKQKFGEKLNALSWEPLLSETNVNILYSSFYDIMCQIFDECFPICQRKVRPIDNQKPYVDDYIKGLIKEKHRILKLYNRNPITYGDEYRYIRNEVNNAVQSAK